MNRERDGVTDEQWARLSPLMPGGCRGKRGPRTNNRLFIDALLWLARSGGRWRDLPENYGNHQTVKRRYYDWVARGVLGDILTTLNPGRRSGMADDRQHRHPCAQPGRRGETSKRGPDVQGLGRSRGGLTTKIHAAVEALAMPCA